MRRPGLNPRRRAAGRQRRVSSHRHGDQDVLATLGPAGAGAMPSRIRRQADDDHDKFPVLQSVSIRFVKGGPGRALPALLVVVGLTRTLMSLSLTVPPQCQLPLAAPRRLWTMAAARSPAGALHLRLDQSRCHAGPDCERERQPEPELRVGELSYDC